MWTCRKCGERWTNGKLRCTCGRARPKRRPTHRDVLKEYPYEWFVEQFGEQCGICGVRPSEDRRLDRDTDHDHGFAPRGLLCWLCNKRLDGRADRAWLRKALDYLDAAAG